MGTHIGMLSSILFQGNKKIIVNSGANIHMILVYRPPNYNLGYALLRAALIDKCLESYIPLKFKYLPISIQD